MHHNIGKLISGLSTDTGSSEPSIYTGNQFMDLGDNLFDDQIDTELIEIFLNSEEYQQYSGYSNIRSSLYLACCSNQFSIVYLNINSILSKLCYVEKLLNSNYLDLLVLQETMNRSQITYCGSPTTS
jgi:hypothetical protein